MGNKVPVPDERMQKTIDMLRMENKELGTLWALFRAHDADKSGEIDIDEFYNMIGEKRSIFGDSIFELIDISNDGTLDFSEFVQTLGTYCMFGRDDVRKFCFYIFDKDKNGYIEQDELTALIDMLHENNLSGGFGGGNCKVAMDKFDTNNDGKIDFKEFTAMDIAYPMLLFPAYRMQENMMERTLGKNWWKERRMMLQGERDAEQDAKDKLVAKEEERMEALRQREIRRKMGYIQYYICFWRRQKYEVQKVAPEEKTGEEETKEDGHKKKKKKHKKKNKEKEKELKKKMKNKNRETSLTTAEDREERKKRRKREKDKDKTRMNT